MIKYVKVVNSLKSNTGNFEYKLNEINVTTEWNPNSLASEEIGGFDFGIEDQILRQLHQGDTIYDVIIGRADIKDAIIKTKFKNLSAIPATIDLAGAELELYDLEEMPVNFTQIALDAVKDQFDYIFIDCPPSLGMLTVKALSISDGVVIPMQCEFYSLEGMSQLLNTVKKIRQLYNPDLQIVGILLTMYNARLTLTRQVVEELRKYYSDLLFKIPISRTVRLSEAPSYGEPICYHDPYCKGSLEYAAVAKELQLRI